MKAYLFLGLGLSFVLLACGNNDIPYDASGVFETTEVIVSAQATGELLSFTVEEGMNVKADEKLGFMWIRYSWAFEKEAADPLHWLQRTVNG